MKILMISPQPYFQPRGTPISVSQRLAALSQLGHEIDLITYHIGEDIPMSGVKIHRIPNVPFIRKVRIGPSIKKLILDFLLFMLAFWMLIRKRYDVIHSHEEAAFMALPLAKIFRTRHFYDMHSSLPQQLENFQYGNYPPIVKLFEILERWVLARADVVITVGKDLESYVKSIEPSAHVVRIENGPVTSNSDNGQVASIWEFGKALRSEGKSVVVYTGNFERYQGVDVLIQGLAKIKKLNHNAVLILVGGTEDQVKELQDHLEDLDLTKDAILLGSVSVNEALAYLEIADVLVSPRIDGTTIPLKLYNYILASKPILASNIPAHNQLLDESTSLLVEPSSHGIAAGLDRILSDEVLRKQLEENSKEMARRYEDSVDLLSQIQQLYSEKQAFPVSAKRLTQSVEE